MKVTEIITVRLEALSQDKGTGETRGQVVCLSGDKRPVPLSCFPIKVAVEWRYAKSQGSWDYGGGESSELSGSVSAGQVICPNCGGTVPADAARCPYCGALNPDGAEKAYLDALEDLRDETDKLDDDVRRGLAADLRGSAKRTVVIVGTVVALFILVFFAVRCSSASEEHREIQGYQERESFKEQHFAELDRLYEAGDDAALSAYALSLLDEPGYEALYSWEHGAYLEACHDWEALEAIRAEIQDGSAKTDDYVWAVSAAMRLAQLDAEGKLQANALAADEEARLAERRVSALQFLQDLLQMSAEEVEAFAVSIEDERGNVERDKLKEGLELRLGQLGIAS